MNNAKLVHKLHSNKRTKIGLPLWRPEFPVPEGIGVTDFGESLRFQTVLQGQEIFPKSPYGRAPTNNEAHDIGSLGISDGLQVLGSIYNRPLLTYIPVPDTGVQCHENDMHL
ncbi:hypothetical protein WN943_006209 [Citrus x changshan-huyou]